MMKATKGGVKFGIVFGALNLAMGVVNSEGAFSILPACCFFMAGVLFTAAMHDLDHLKGDP